MKSDLPDRTFAFAERIVKLCLALESDSSVAATLMRQLLRAGTSIGANVEEAQASESKRDFVHKYSIAVKEARETHYWLRLLAKTDIIPPSRLEPLTAEANELLAILTSICKKNR
ncbi:four helix bundle protein [Novipirellula caenicola]|uniref:Four helix bundle protein n=1 Tax=Novipirellula caenicola TaxID=1536901 RepID=A0ABP9VVI0_9BACT